jgi:hypothetical protein
MPRRKTPKRKAKPVRPPAKRYRTHVLNAQLDEAYRSFCGEGLTETKRRLELDASPLAQALLLAIRIECVNRRAKRRKNRAEAQLYREKRQLIRAFIEHGRNHGFDLRRADSAEPGQPHVLYAYLPGCEQISWHASLDGIDLPPEKRGWDGKSCSTLSKLERAVKACLRARSGGKPETTERSSVCSDS